MGEPAPTRPSAERPAPFSVAARVGSASRWIGAALFLVTAFLPVYGWHARPQDFDARPRASKHVFVLPSIEHVPAREIALGLESGWKENALIEGVWRVRPAYPYLLAPLWIVALFFGSRSGASRSGASRSDASRSAASRPGSRLGRWAGLALFAVSVAVATLEAFYLAHDYRGLLAAGWLHGVETSLVWLLVCAVLFWRPRGAGFLDPRAAVSAQALLTLCHALTFPFYDGAAWLGDGFSASAVASTIAANYRPAFWIALAALGLAAAPLYVGALFRQRPSITPPPEPASVASEVREAAPG